MSCIFCEKVAEIQDNYLDAVDRCGMFLDWYGVDHIYSKLFPMHKTDNNPDFKTIESSQNKYFNSYEGYISSYDSFRAYDSDLSSLAKMIVNYCKSNIK